MPLIDLFFSLEKKTVQGQRNLNRKNIFNDRSPKSAKERLSTTYLPYQLNNGIQITTSKPTLESGTIINSANICTLRKEKNLVLFFVSLVLLHYKLVCE